VADAITESGCSVQAIRATGGFTGSPVWVQILADVLGRNVAVPEESEGSGLGAALLALVATGLLPDLQTAAGLIGPGRVIEPQPAHAATYDKVYDAFRSAQPILGAPLNALQELRADGRH